MQKQTNKHRQNKQTNLEHGKVNLQIKHAQAHRGVGQI